MSEILRIALPVPLPRLFDYLAPAGAAVEPGMRVEVPFAHGTRVGVVVEQAASSAVDPARLKAVGRVLDEEPLFTPELRTSLTWAGHYWLGLPGDVWLGALPTWLRGRRPWPVLGERLWQLTDDGHTALEAGTRRGSSRALLQALADGPRTAAELVAVGPNWRAAARRLVAAGLVAEDEGEPPARAPQPGPQLSNEQAGAIATIEAHGPRFGTFVLDGVTGSGKTEVYIRLIARTLAAGRQTLLLVPEIGLAPQTLRRLSARLGVAVEVLHSNLAEGERARAWLRARTGRARVVVGTRSAVFTPLPEAGLIIVDEEHDASYKQQEGFRYHARDLAIVRARELDVPVLLGSATPSLESLAQVAAGKRQRLVLGQRPGQRQPPQLRVLDSRGPRAPHGLGPALLESLDACVAAGQQALVFRNRRGYAPVLICQACGWHSNCSACERPQTLHRARGQLICHHCGQWQRVPRHCPGCGGGPLKPLGFGTERIEDFLRERYPEVPVLRVDSETTRRRQAFEQILQQLQQDGPMILVGTQMLAKGHDLPGLTLAAISGVDESLFSVDYRAGEKLAQLVVQVAGRAGRAEKRGTVLLQTQFPEHPLLAELLQHGYGKAAHAMLDERRQASLPPWSHQALLRVRAAQQVVLDRFLEAARAALPQATPVRVLGPLPAPMPLRAGQHRGQLLLEADRRSDLRAVLDPWWQALHRIKHPAALHWSVDVDPMDLY